MGRRGPRSQHATGVGYTTAKGYHRIYDPEQRRNRLAHDVEWERHNGPIPEGFEIHHRNHQKQDNSIENLELVDDITHKRLDSPHYRRDPGGEWERRCRVCRIWKPATVDHFYFTREGWLAYGRCRPCHIRIVCESKQRRRAVV